MIGAIKNWMSGRGIGASLVQQTCPFCFDRFKLADTPFRCVGASCGFERDEQRDKAWADGASLKKVLPSGGRYRDSVTCGECKRESTKRLCPHCHMELPAEFGRFPMMVFAMIGAKNTGKSHYLAVLIEQIKKNIGPDLDVLLVPLNDDTRERFDRDFRSIIYEKKQIITATRRSADTGTKKPLAYSLTFSSRDRRGTPVTEKVMYLSFFDTSGEDMVADTAMESYTRYIAHADGVILLFDPLQLPYIRASLPPGTPLTDDPNPAMMMQVVERTIRLIRGSNRLSAVQKVETPIAVAFSKFDAVEEMLADSQLQVLNPSVHRSGFNLADHRGVQNEVRSLLDQWDCKDLVQLVESQFKHHAYFGVSSLGCNPPHGGSIPRVIPRRVEDPLLWLLCHHKYIKGVEA
jgi:hypothetical protein